MSGVRDHGRAAPVMRYPGVCDYYQSWQQMVEFTRTRDAATRDEIWFLQHHPVYTRGIRSSELPAPAGRHIPVVQTNRGGLMTYHAPGQLVVYVLLDVKKLNIGPRHLVNRLEQVTIEVLDSYGLEGERRAGAPGVYVDGKKIAALGLRFSRGYCYHGLSFNIDLDLAPYGWIDPCGFADLQVTRLQDHVGHGQADFAETACRFQERLGAWLQSCTSPSTA